MFELGFKPDGLLESLDLEFTNSNFEVDLAMIELKGLLLELSHVQVIPKTKNHKSYRYFEKE